MNVVGFEAFMLETIISRELFSCSATTLPGPPSCFLSFSKRAKFLILTCSGPAALSCSFFFAVAGLMFNSRDVQQPNIGAWKRKNQSGDQSQFHMTVVFFLGLTSLRECFRSDLTKQFLRITELSCHSLVFKEMFEASKSLLMIHNACRIHCSMCLLL